MSYLLLIACLVLGAIYVVSLKFLRRDISSLPPGPPGLPVIGNVLDIPADRPTWLTFADWAKKYGDIVHISLLGQSSVILSSPEIIYELFDRRGAIYSDRPSLPMAGDLVGYVDSVPLCPYGSRHREYRRMMSTGSVLSPRKASELYPVQEQKSRELLMRIMNSQAQLRSQLRWVIAAIVFQISHGYTVLDMNDPLVQLAEQANHEFALSTIPGAYLVDVLPILRYVPDWLPGVHFKTQANQWRRTTERLRDEAYESVKAQVAEGTAAPSFTTTILEENPRLRDEDDIVLRWASTSFYSAGADTSVSALESFFLAMSLYPDVQRTAQAEIHQVVGPSRLPGFVDRPNLPYVEALLNEVHRWNPVAPLALPHRLIRDDVIDDYLLPAGSTVFANNWAILHDPVRYPDPFKFMPERYLANNSDGINPEPTKFTFGYGRRVCPGQGLADTSLFIIIARILAVFDVSKAVDPRGMLIEPNEDYTTGMISHPKTLDCRVAPRSADAERLISGYGHGSKCR
ncbi:Multifunctional cytochrome P450 monooxygenase af510 [Sparassis crispa]|uniref:Multifunctional cytochrome P450 monooxygenase af510 n=1 Tax=Sparassis crispa TaxID=139825 RepID=A0A401H306_9APHY|nr:Multifunctional cytochrome P450 monooxygenase af510 [Sparassis crispa]GBE88750.1 Multifunctional cytochrome P450 monooxygenase af510 [Sparassis crispa]